VRIWKRIRCFFKGHSMQYSMEDGDIVNRCTRCGHHEKDNVVSVSEVVAGVPERVGDKPANANVVCATCGCFWFSFHAINGDAECSECAVIRTVREKRQKAAQSGGAPLERLT